MIRYTPGRPAVAVAFAAALAAWLFVLVGAAGVAVGIWRTNPLGLAALAVVCVGVPTARAAIRRWHELRWIRTAITPRLLHRRHHGNLAVATADEHRPLRSIGSTRAEVVWRTDLMLDTLTRVPGVRIFRGVRLPGQRVAVAALGVAAGRRLILMEPVAWPPGTYTRDAEHGVRCDGEPIGQSAQPLAEAVRMFRRLLPRSHRVSGLVVVHRSGPGNYQLPADDREIAWVLADAVTRRLDTTLARHGHLVSRHTVAALIQQPPTMTDVAPGPA